MLYQLSTFLYWPIRVPKMFEHVRAIRNVHCTKVRFEA
jgi:hypothetical protein